MGLSGASQGPLKGLKGPGRPEFALYTSQIRLIHKSDSPYTQVRLTLHTSQIRLLDKGIDLIHK